MDQVIRYVTTDDGVRLAWATSGNGPTLLKASNWLTHLEFDRDSPVWRHWIRFLNNHFTVLRYDERGCGMSDWELEGADIEHWYSDFRTFVDAARPEPPYAVLGISQGGYTSIRHAIDHPERVSHLILYGTYARGWKLRKDPENERFLSTASELMKLGWGKDNPVYRQVFTARFIPEGTQEQFDWFNELCRRTTSAEIAHRLFEARGQVDIGDLLPQVRVPTLVIHARHDEIVSIDEGIRIASRIPNAQFVELDSRNHILLEHEPAWERFQEAVLDFTGRSADKGNAAGRHGEDPVFGALTQREREILVEIARGQTNQQVGNRLFISEKTVRNNLTRIFEKLGVHSRAQAIVMARDRGLDLGNR